MRPKGLYLRSRRSRLVLHVDLSYVYSVRAGTETHLTFALRRISSGGLAPR